MRIKICASPECNLKALGASEFCTLHEIRDNKSRTEIEEVLAEFSGVRETRIKNAYLVNADLSGIHIQHCNFQYSNLRGCNFQDARFYKAGFDFSDVSRANFQNAILESCDFRRAKDLRNVDWFHAIFDGVRFPRATILGLRCIYDTAENKQLEKALNIYQNLREIYKAQGSIATAGIFYELEMDTRRHLATGREKLWLNILWLMCGYGERPLNVVLCFLCTIIGFALLYAVSHLEGPDGEIGFQLHETLYFSLVTFTSLGYGDIRPVGTAKFFAGIEALAGLFLTSLFIFVFCRKMLR